MGKTQEVPKKNAKKMKNMGNTTTDQVRNWNKHNKGKKRLTATECKFVMRLVNVMGDISNYGYRRWPKRKGYNYEDKLVKAARQYMGDVGY